MHIIQNNKISTWRNWGEIKAWVKPPQNPKKKINSIYFHGRHQLQFCNFVVAKANTKTGLIIRFITIYKIKTN